MNDTRPFNPLYQKSSQTAGVTTAGTPQPSVTVAATAAAAPSAIFPGVDRNNYVQIQIANQGTTWAFVNFGVFGAVTPATVAASYPVAPGSVVIVSVDPEVTGASVILASGTASVTFTRGEGT